MTILNIKLKNILIPIGIIVVFLLLFNQCTKDKLIIGLGGYTKQNIEIKVDTIGIKRDTIYLPIKNTIHVIDSLTKLVIEKDIKYQKLYSRLEGWSSPVMPLNDTIPALYSYETKVSDTIISGTIFSYFDGANNKLLHQYLDYSLNKPILAREVITIEKTKEIEIDKTKYNRFGIGVETSSNIDIGLKGVYQSKDIQFQVGFKRYNIDNFNDKIIEVGIIKLF